jgi:hypothetical protein
MSQITTLSSNVIEQKKTETLDAQSLRKVVPFRDINIINEKTLEYRGHNLNMTKTAFKNLLNIIGMSQNFSAKFEKLFNAEAKAQFINRMKDAMTSNRGSLNDVTLVLNPISKSVVGISRKTSVGISNSQFVQMTDNIINEQGLDVTNWSTDPHTGIITVNTFNPKSNFEIGGLTNEVFTGGVTFKNTPTAGMQVLPYVNRMWCSNGLTTSVSEESHILYSLDKDNMEKFHTNLNDLRKNNYAPIGFGDRVRTANNTRASLHEMKQAYDKIHSYVGERAERWVPFNENLAKYESAGFTDMNADQTRGAKTNQSVWSVVNGLTHFATHNQSLVDTNITASDETNMMIQAGNLFGKKSFDNENMMPDLFDKNVLNKTIQTGALLN